MKNIYINWAAYDELSDNVELTEELAMFQLENLIRLRKLGVRMDYYLMDAFWYDAECGFMSWRKPHWRKGPGRWLSKCKENGIIPGLWLPTNNINVAKMKPFKDWKNSLSADGNSYCMFRGNFLNGLISAMEYWAKKGVKLFKFDFANFNAATVDVLQSMLPYEIVTANEIALRSALCDFRKRHSDCVLLAYNGFGGQITNTSLPFRKTVDVRWLDCFDAMYCGDPRPADVPCMNFWRSKDIYSDHMVREFYRNGIPLERIDNSAFMIGKTGTCYYRGKEAWKGMLILALAKGSHFNTYYGNLELIDDKDAKWMAKVQKLFLSLSEFCRTSIIGGVPGMSEPYGYILCDGENALITVVNPSQEFKTILLDFCEFRTAQKLIIFHDKGFVPELKGSELTLAPEQLCVVAIGKYANSENILGIEEDISVPKRSKKLSAKIARPSFNCVEAVLVNPPVGIIRAVFTQSHNGIAFRSTGGSPPHGKKLGEIIQINAFADDEQLIGKINYDKAIWSGLSWGVAEFEIAKNCKKLKITAKTAESQKLDLDIKLYLEE